MADRSSLLLPLDAPVAVTAMNAATAPVDPCQPGKIHPSPDVRPAVGRTSTEATSTAEEVGNPHPLAEPKGLPPRRLDICSSCFGDGEIAPRQREFRRIWATGVLLCRKCFAKEKRA